jgi:hypothetical protein
MMMMLRWRLRIRLTLVGSLVFCKPSTIPAWGSVGGRRGGKGELRIVVVKWFG